MIKNWSGRGLLAIAGLLLASAALAQKVAVLGGPDTASWNNDVQSKLVSTGLFPGGVDIINIATTTPSLATLKQYNSVLVYSDGAGFADGVTLGNNLADYVDQGGGVVTAVFVVPTLQPGMLVVLSLGLMLAVAWWMRRSGMR